LDTSPHLINETEANEVGDHPAKYARFTKPGSQRSIVIELAAPAKQRKNNARLTRSCGDSEGGPPRVEFVCDVCSVWKMWEYDLRTLL